MLKPGETVVAAVNHRDFVLVFGSHGTVLRMWFDTQLNSMVMERHADLGVY